MILKALELHGFKSFPDKTVLSFNGDITAVVGPNGSGKSNISDAIRWVLGEQSSKELRGAKMEDVIFNGTEKRPGMGFAEVTLVINNENRILNFDDNEVRVTRRYYRSGDSEYQLNGAKVRLRDVQVLFMDTGLGRDGYSIVGQGRIGDIISTRSNERREIFEEAAGIAKYRFRKNEAERRLDNAQENLLRLYDILKELEERVGPLQVQSEKAKKFLELAGEKKDLEISVWLRDMDAARDQLRDLSAKLEMVRGQHDKAEEAMGDFDRRIEEINEKAQQLEAQMDALRRRARELQEEAAGLDSRVAVLRNDRSHNEEDIVRIRGDIDREDDGDRRIGEDIAACTERIAARRESIADAERKRAALTEEMQAIIHNTDAVAGQMESLNATAADMDFRLSDLRVASVTDTSAVAEIADRLDRIAEQEAACAEQNRRVTADLEKTKAAAKVCGDRVEELRNAVGGYELRVNSRTGKTEEAKKKADQLHLDAEAKARRVQMLEELERNMEGFSQSVKLVMKQAERGALSGILGPVSRLIETKGDYALAIETALGAAAQNIVCENENDAKRGIGFLKENNAGRATFLPLTSIKGRTMEERGVEEAAGFIGIASELVTYDKKYADIVGNLLGRTVVAEDLDYAVSIARKFGYRFRIVTLDGQQVNAGGSLTGGSNIKGAGIMSRRAEIERLEAETQDLRRKAEEALAAFRELQQDLSAAEAALSGARGELTAAQEDAIRFEGELRRLTDLSEAAERELAGYAAERESLTARSEECRRRGEETAKTIAAVTAEKEALEQKIAELSGGRQQLTEQRETLAARMSEYGMAILGYQKDIEAEEANVRQLEERRNDAGVRHDELEAQIASLEQQNVHIDGQIEILLAEAARLRGEADGCTAEEQKLVQVRTAGEAETTALRQQMRDSTDERENTTREITRLEGQYATAQQTMETLAHRLYEEYELTVADAAAIAKPLEDLAAANRRLTELKNKIRALGNVNVEAIEEYKEVSERYEFLSVQVKDVEKSRDELLALIEDLSAQMREIFLDRFKKIQYEFGIVFAELFNGGKGEITLENPDDILESGIVMNIQPPGKKIHNLESLSGGEKALTAIALLFAILKVTPSPFCVLDEIEAALDDVNVDRYAAYLRRLCDRSQFIAITHRRGTMEEADVLYGVTMQEKGVTKLLEMHPAEVEERLGIKAN